MPASVLIVDDEEAMLFAVSEYLRGRFDQVDFASTELAAKVLLKDRSYSVIITDLRLPPNSYEQGLKFISFIAERYPLTRIILLTAYGTPSIQAEARKRGADAVVIKPTPLHEIALIAERLCQLPNPGDEKRTDDSSMDGEPDTREIA